MANVILKNGLLKKEEYLNFKDIKNELSRFITLAIGKDGEEWYVQTSDILCSTQLSKELYSSESFEEVEKLAKVISEITSLDIEYWEKPKEIEKLAKQQVFDLVCSKFLHFGENNNPHSSQFLLNAYTVVRKDSDYKAPSPFYSTYVVEGEDYQLVTLETEIPQSESKEKVVEILDSIELAYKNNEVTFISEIANADFEKAEKSMKIQKTIDLAESYGMLVEDDCVNIFEATTDTEYDEGRFSVFYDTETLFYNSDINVSLVVHKIDLKTNILDGSDLVESILTDYEDSEKIMHFDYEGANKAFEHFKDNPPLINIKEDVQDHVNTLYHMYLELDAMSDEFKNSKLKGIAKIIEECYDELQDFVDEI